MTNWKETTLGKAVDIIIDHRGMTPKKMGGDWSSVGYRAISAKSIKNGQLVNEGQMNLLPESLYRKWMKEEVEYGDIFLTSEAPLGEHILWKSEEKLVLSQRIFGIRTSKDILDPFFLNYFIDSKYYQHQLKSRESGSTVTGIKQSELLKTKILLPSLPEQKEIAGVLSSLDDKIELLREENKTLEATAQSIFKEWFVNFNFPNAEGKPYKSSGGKMIDSELGEIPGGWRVGKLGEVVDIRGGTTPRTEDSDLWGGNISWTSPRDLSGSSDVFLLDTEKRITERGLAKISSGLLPVGTLLLSSRAPIGYLALTDIELSINQGYIAFLPDKYLSNHFMFLWLRVNMDTVIGSANGSTFLEISKGSFRAIQLIVPQQHVLNSFQSCVSLAFKKILSNIHQIKTLSTLRDTLLPKLMSGQK